MGSYEHNHLTRRKMISAIGWLALIPMAGLWGYMVKREQFYAESRLLRIRLSDIPQGNSFYNEYWVKRSSDGFKVFPTRCTHLGCRIRPADGSQMICPCHGSVFNAENGSVIKGPAEKPLEMLNFNIEDDYLTIFIK